jgi:iron complex outermembrane receptor protein
MMNEATAQSTIRGRVSDFNQTGGIPGANIRLSTGQQTIADDDGRFQFATLPTGMYQLTVSSVGYKRLDTSLSTNQPWVLVLERKQSIMQPIEIKAVRAGEHAPFTQVTIRAREIEKMNMGQDIPFLLNQTPSVVVHSDAGNGIGYTGIRIRGSDATRINLTLNGIPYNDAESQGLFFVNLPDFSSSVNSVQIQRGVGTSSNGTGAFGASINMSTNETREKAYGELHNSAGSFNTWKNTVKLGSGLINEQFTFDARLSRIKSDGFVDRAASDLQSFHLSGAYLKPKTSLRLNVFSGKEKTYQAWNGIPESMLETDRTYNSAGTEKPGDPYDNETDNYRQTHYQLFFNRKFSEKLSLQTALFYTRGMGYYEQYKADEDYLDYGIPNPTIGGAILKSTDLVRQLWLDNHYFGQTFSLQYKDDKKEIIAGGGVTRYIGDHYGKIIWAGQGIDKDRKWYDLDAFKNDVNLYLKWQQRLSQRLGLFADLQYRNVGYELNGFRNNPGLLIDNRWNFLNPKIGFEYKLPAGRAYLSWALANKEPNRDDFEAGAVQQPSHETLHDFEIGYEKMSAKSSWSVTGYYMRYHNQLVLTGMINDVGAYARTNIPESYRAGVELSGRWKPADCFDVQGNLTASDNRIMGYSAYYDDYDNGGQKIEPFDKTTISFSPSLTGAASLNLRPIPRTEISLLSKYVSRQYLDNTGRESRSLDPYYLQDILVTWKPTVKIAGEVALTLQVNNIFNKRYEPNGYTFSYIYGGSMTTENFYYPMAGTNVMVGLSLKW